ncbi:MAG: MFS transporter, partial [Pseudomonadota bacterium]
AYANRQVALSQLLSAMLMAQFAGLVGTGLIASWFGWRIAIATATGVSALALIVTVFGLRPRKVVQRPPFRVATLRESYADVFANPRAVVCYTAVFVEGLAIFGLLPHVATMLEARGAGGIAEAGLVLACMGIGGLIFTLGVRRLLAQLGGMFNLMRVGGIVAALGFAGIAMQASWPFEAGAFLLVGLGFYAVHNSLQTLATELAPEHRGSSVALHAFFFFLGHAAGPPIYSLSFAAIGQAQTLLLVALTVFVGGFVLAAALKARSASAE